MLASLIDGQSLTSEQMTSLMISMLSGELSEPLMAAVLVALSIKGETSEELLASVCVMRQHMTPMHLSEQNWVDNCGTGGDCSGLFNVSTASALVASACGAKVAKHGNRSVSSASGSANVLEAGGVYLDLPIDAWARCCEALGIGFLFAPQYHSAVRYVAGVRKALGVKTLFNLLGPLCHPASVKRQVVGVYDRKWQKPFIEVLSQLGTEKAWVLTSSDGLDEISCQAITQVTAWDGVQVTDWTINPKAYGLFESWSDVVVDSPSASYKMIQDVFKDKNKGKAPKSARALILLNTAATLVVAGVVQDFESGLALADDALMSGSAREKWENLVQFTEVFKP
jgi:anthranilate phosphoribosyltransferase